MLEKYTDSKVYELTRERFLDIKTEQVSIDKDDRHQVICRTLCSAISVGTEIAAWRGDPPLRPGNIYPRLVGYCNVSQIEYIGPSVVSFRTGDRVLTFQSHRSHFSCSYEDIITKIPDESDIISVSTTYLFHLGYNALIRCNFISGHSVAIVGLGTIGLATVPVFSSSGGIVHTFSARSHARDLSIAIGASGSWDKGDPFDIKSAIDIAGRGGFDIVLTTSNSWSDWKLALKLARKFGVIGIIGFPGRAQPSVDFNPLSSEYVYDKQLTIIGCGQSPDYNIPAHDIRFTVKRNCEHLMRCIISGKFPAKNIIADVVPWRDLEVVYQKLEDKSDSGLTRILDWSTE